MGGPKSNSAPVIADKLGGNVRVKSRHPDYSHRFRRANLPQRGIPGWALWLGTAVMFVNGFYMIQRKNNKNQNYVRETREHSMAIYAYRQAEADTLLLGKLNAQKAFEAKVMKNVEGWVPGESVYASRWVPPNKQLQKQLDSVQL